MNFITFDIETYSPSKQEKIDTSEFRVSVCGAYISWTNEYLAFLEEDIADFLELVKSADLIVGYNHLWFDFPVLQKYANWDLAKQTNNYDILLEIEKKIGYKVKLNDVCKANLTNDVKTDSYETYKHYYWDKNWYPLIDYCMNDVRLTNQLFMQILQTGKLKYPDLHETHEIEVDQPVLNKKQPDQTAVMDSIF